MTNDESRIRTETRLSIPFYHESIDETHHRNAIHNDLWDHVKSKHNQPPTALWQGPVGNDVRKLDLSRCISCTRRVSSRQYNEVHLELEDSHRWIKPWTVFVNCLSHFYLTLVSKDWQHPWHLNSIRFCCCSSNWKENFRWTKKLVQHRTTNRPSAFPAPRTKCISSMNRMIPPLELSISFKTDFRRSSNSPRWLAPAKWINIDLIHTFKRSMSQTDQRALPYQERWDDAVMCLERLDERYVVLNLRQ